MGNALTLTFLYSLYYQFIEIFVFLSFGFIEAHCLFMYVIALCNYKVN